MQHESASDVRRDLARRITDRAMRMVDQAVVVPVAGDPVRSLSVREWQHFRDEEEALRAANGVQVRALRARCHSPNSFALFPDNGNTHGMEVSRPTIKRLIDKGLMEWVNSVRSAAVLTERGKRGA